MSGHPIVASNRTNIPVQNSHTVLIDPGQDAFLFVVETGRFTLEVEAPQGRRRVLDFLGAGDVVDTRMLRGLGAIRLRALINGRLWRQHQHVGCDHHTTVGIVDGAELMAKRALLATLIVGLPDIDQRVASFLLLYAERFAADEAGKPIEIQVARENVADYILVNPDTLSRSYSRLRALGALSRNASNRLVVKDRMALANATPLAGFISEIGAAR